MHSKVFQITDERIDKEYFLDETTLTQGDGSYYDYCSDISEEERAEQIAILVDHVLPNGMFTLVGVDEMVYHGGAEKLKEKWVKAIHDKASAVNTNNVLDWIGAAYQLEKELKNPLHTDYHFYLSEETYQNYAEPSNELVKKICELKEGDHLFVGGVIDFHF